MKKILFIVFISFIVIEAQTEIGSLTTGNSTHIFRPTGDYTWIQLILIDSTVSTGTDTLQLEIENGYNDWTPINCKNLKTFEDDYLLIPGKIDVGISYMVWYTKEAVRLRKLNVASTDTTYYKFKQIKAE